MSDVNPLEDFARTYYADPVGFVRDMLGVEPLPYQAEFLEALAKGERRISIRSGHGTGKSTASSWAMSVSYTHLTLPTKRIV